MLIGFGSTEMKTAMNIIEECISKRDKNKDKFEKELKKIKKKYDDLSEEYKNKNANDVPERYSYFWYSVYKIYNIYFITFDFHHINRRHPFSPDGWAMIKTNWIAEIRLKDDLSDEEEIQIYKSV